MVAMTGLPSKVRCRVGELAASPLDIPAAAEIRAVLATALRSSGASRSGRKASSNSCRTTTRSGRRNS